jgi:hypothetical protein
MKTIQTLFLLLSSFFSFLTSAQIPNASFEDWSPIYYNGITWNEPGGWDTENYFNKNEGEPESAVKITTAFDGSYALRLTNINNSYNYPAYAESYSLSNGTSGSHKTGFPISTRPSALKGFYKYQYTNKDTFIATVKVFNNGEVVGFGEFLSDSQTSIYTSFSVPIDYLYPGVPFDSASILILAGSYRVFKIGSQLTIDNLSFSNTTGIDDIQPEIYASLYPNPSQGATNIEFEQSEKGTTSIKVIDILGNTIKKIENVYSAGKHNVDLETSSLRSGLYFVHIIQNNNTKILKLFMERE